MSTIKILWQNKTWAIHRLQCDCGNCSGKPGLMLEKKTTGQCDYPIRYDDGKVAYDYPERIPAYIMKQVARQYPIA